MTYFTGNDILVCVFQLTSSRRGWPLSGFLRYLSPHFNSHPHEEDDPITLYNIHIWNISTHILMKRMTVVMGRYWNEANISTHILMKRMTEIEWAEAILQDISTHILMKRMTAILNKIFSFKIKLYIHYNILFAIFYIYNSILYPFSSPKRSYSGANDSVNYCSLAFRTPRFPIPSLQIHFS